MKQYIKPFVPPFLWSFGRIVSDCFTKNRIKGRDKAFIEMDALGFRWKLESGSVITRAILQSGVWERDTTNLVLDFVKPGMKTLAIGANFGYYVLLMARNAGPNGHVWAFEPTKHYRELLQWHIDANQLGDRVTIVPFGLSDKSSTAGIDLTPQSASMHYTPGGVVAHEEIELRALDEVASELNIDQIDFISMDIDGHEHAFLLGAKMSLSRYMPPIAMEFAQRCLYFAGSDVLEVSALLTNMGYVICSETTREPFKDEFSFLLSCGNYNTDCNALALPRQNLVSTAPTI